MKRIFLITIAILSIISCKKRDENGNIIIYEELYKSHWLLGEWAKTDSLGTLKEIWETKDDSTYFGQSYYIQGKDTVHKETIELMQDKEFLFYIPTIQGENNNQPVSFQMTKDEDSLLVFENPKHDFPKKIEYKLLKNNSILATISGKLNGKNNSEKFEMQKVKK